MFCPQCGTAHTPGGRFCGNCGLLLPFATLAGAAPDAGRARADVTGFATPNAAPRHVSVSGPSFTLAVVACVVAFGLIFMTASAIVRTLTGDSMESHVAARAESATTPSGAMGALLSPSRRAVPAAEPSKLK